MNPYKLINKIYKNNPKAKKILLIHSNQVKKKALKIAIKYQNKISKKINMKLIENGALLHDIGIIKINNKRMNCHGKVPFIKHNYEGFKILLKHLHPKLALITLRHTGVGLTREEIIKEKLPLPKINMVPKTIEEEIVCLADKFYSKSKLNLEYSIEDIKKEIKQYGQSQEKRLNYLINKYL